MMKIKQNKFFPKKKKTLKNKTKFHSVKCKIIINNKYMVV